MRGLWQDVRYGLRMLAKSPAFTVVAVVTLALGIGANTAIFSVINGVLLRPLPYADPDRLVWLWDVQEGLSTAPFSGPEFLDYQAQNQAFEQLAGFRQMGFSLTAEGPAERLSGTVVTPNFFTLFGVQPILGRGFAPDEAKAGGARVVVLSHEAWQKRFGGDRNVLGRALTLNTERVTIVGVMPPEFRFPRTDFWINPRNTVPETFANSSTQYLTQRGWHYMPVVGRLKPGVTLAQAKSDLDALAAGLRQQNSGQHGINVVSLYELIVGDIRPTLMILLSAVGVVLLIACANLANLMLSRATGRRREIAVRAALGASRSRVFRQLLTESVLVAVLGGVAGLLLAQWGVNALVRANADQIPRATSIQLDRYVLGFALGVSVLTGVLFGMAPALQAARGNLMEVLKEGARGSGPRRPLRSLLVVSEVALSLVLLIGAGLLVRSFARVLAVEPGFNPSGLVSIDISFSGSEYSKPGSNTAFLARLLPRLGSLPGVEGLAVANDLPLEGQDTNGYPTLEGRTAEERVVVGQHVVNSGYFRAMGIRLLKGRTFTEADAAGAPAVAVINQAMAKHFWPNEDPIGKSFQLFGSDDTGRTEIVGIVADVKHNGLSSPPSFEAYAPIAQFPWVYVTISVRTRGDVAGMVTAVRREVQSLDAGMPVAAVRTMDQVMAETLASRRLPLTLVAAFASLALVLAVVGIYGVMSYSVMQRAHEVGIRMALGAQPGDVVRLVLRHGMTLAACGVAIGLAGAYWAMRLLESQLFGVAPTDPLTFAAVAAALAAVALVACWIPARRAARVDPLIALRYE